MVSKNTAKYLKSLQLKKYRKQEQRFLVEGAKSVLELLASGWAIELVVASSAFGAAHATALQASGATVVEAPEAALGTLGTLQSNNAALAVAHCKPNAPLHPQPGQWALALDDIRDPGNLGTIIRIADWYGVSTIICSETTAEWYNPKVVSATMGSFTRVALWYTDLAQALAATPLPTYGALLAGQSAHSTGFGPEGVLVVGNESHGISAAVAAVLNHQISIPRFGQAESLNAGIATAVLLDNIRRSPINNEE